MNEMFEKFSFIIFTKYNFDKFNFLEVAKDQGLCIMQ